MRLGRSTGQGRLRQACRSGGSDVDRFLCTVPLRLESQMERSEPHRAADACGDADRSLRHVCGQCRTRRAGDPAPDDISVRCAALKDQDALALRFIHSRGVWRSHWAAMAAQKKHSRSKSRTTAVGGARHHLAVVRANGRLYQRTARTIAQEQRRAASRAANPQGSGVNPCRSSAHRKAGKLVVRPGTPRRGMVIGNLSTAVLSKDTFAS